MAECFCGCGRSVKSLGHIARANRLGRKLTEAVPLSQAVLARYPEHADGEWQRLAADGPSRIAQVRTYVHGEMPRELLDADGVNAWFETFRNRYGGFMKDATDGWSGINPMKLTRLLLLGERAQATIVSVHDTGMTVNEEPRVQIAVRFTPAGASAPVERTLKMFVSRVAVPQRGQTVQLAYDLDDPEWMSFRHDSLRPGAAMPPPSAAAGPELDKGDAGANASGDPVERLEKLAALRDAGALTDEEFASAKRQVLGG